VSKPSSAEIDAEFRAAGLEPLEPYAGAANERLCRCVACGTERWVRLSNLRKGGVACRWCHGWTTWGRWGEQARAMEGSWRGVGSPKESLDWLGSLNLAPLTPVGDLYFPVGVVCLNCGETLVTVPARIKSSAGRGWYGCERCAADRKRQVRNDAPALFEANGLELLTPCRGEYVPQRARCAKCGAERHVSYHDLHCGTAPACWTCRTGIGVNEPHRVYLFHFPALGVYKIGITHNRDAGRLVEHAIHGGELIDVVVVDSRHAARLVEQAIRAMFAPWHESTVDKDDFLQGGWTETWRDCAPPLGLEAFAATVLHCGHT